MTVRDQILAAAAAMQGKFTYRLDPPPDGVETIDCSLFVLGVLAAAGVPLPKGVRTAEQIRQASAPIAFADVRPGDLLFFEKTYPTSERATHVGISLGAGTKRMWDANSVNNVGLTDISTPYWQEHIFEARRTPGLTDAPAAEGVRGIDVASYQGNPDWNAVKASGIAFAITKATEGVTYLNETFRRNWAEIKRVGLTRGAYHYAHPDDNSPEDEAAYFVGMVSRDGIGAGDILALDLETGTGPLGDWARRWLLRVEALTGVKPIVYTGAWVAEKNDLEQTPELGASPLWLAAYQAQLPAAPAPWTSVAIWQHSDKGSVPGITGAVDMNRALVPLASLGKDGLLPAYHRDGDVGSGLLAAMTAAGTIPAAPSTFLPLGRSPAVIEECVGMNGTVYRWHLPTSQLWTYPAA